MAFVRNMFIRPELTELPTFDPNFTVLHAPEFQADPATPRHAHEHVHRSQHRRADDPDRRHALRRRAQEVDVHGDELPASQAGRSLDALLGEHRRRPATPRCSSDCREPARRHCRRIRSAASSATTSTAGRTDGIFNFEGGCYAKVINLSPESEPDIYRTTQMFGTMLENVVLDPATKQVKFADQSITENTRASYPLHYIPNHVPRRPRRTSAERRVPDGRCVRRAAADRAADAASRRCTTSSPGTRRRSREPSAA